MQTDPIEVEREARFCRHAWEDGAHRGRIEGLFLGAAIGFAVGAFAVAWLIMALAGR